MGNLVDIIWLLAIIVGFGLMKCDVVQCSSYGAVLIAWINGRMASEHNVHQCAAP